MAKSIEQSLYKLSCVKRLQIFNALTRPNKVQWDGILLTLHGNSSYYATFGCAIKFSKYKARNT
jgi:hypothetical protein